MSENGGTIRNTMTLEVRQFEKSLDRATQRLNELDKRLDGTSNSSKHLEQSMNSLLSNISGVNTQFGALGKSLSNVLTNMGGVVTVTNKAGASTKKLTDNTKQLNKETKAAEKSTDRLTDFAQRYDRKLGELSKTTQASTKAHQKHTEATKELGTAQANVARKTTKDSAKALKTTLKDNDKQLKSHKDSLAEINRLKRESEAKLAMAQRELNKRFFGRNANSQSPQALQLRENVKQAREELKAVTATQEKVVRVVSGLTQQNNKLKQGADLAQRQNQAVEAQIALRQRLLHLKELENRESAKQLKLQQDQNRQAKNFVGPVPYSQMSYGQRMIAQKAMRQSHAQSGNFVGPQPATRAQIQAQQQAKSNFVGPPIASQVPFAQHNATMAQQRQLYGQSSRFMGPLPATKQQQQMQAYHQNSKNFVGPQPATHPNNVLSFGAQQQQAQALARQQQQMHSQQMQNLRQQQVAQQQSHKEQLSFAKEIGMMYAAMKVNQSIFGAVHQNSDLEQAKYRLSMWNLPGEEEQRFIDKSKDMTTVEKYLTHTESMDARLDAMAAMGGNHESTIDSTVAGATRVAHSLRASGSESGSNSDLIKNLYGFAEARQVMNDPQEILKSFETILKMSTVSNGKVKVADIETVARNMGSMRADVSSDGWLQIAALAEQFKTAGGGNGGGGGVATVGTMLKMMGLYGSGRTITNRAVESLYGADLLNDFDGGDAEKSFKDNAKQIKDFTKMMKNAGFKDTKAMGDNPVEFFAQMRGQILDSMMRENNFSKYFGEDTKRWTYGDKGEMIGNDGKVVAKDEQNKIEQAGITRWAAQMGWSNRMVDGMATMLNKVFIDRAREVAESAKKSADSQQALAEAQATLKGNTDNLMASLGRLAESFAPLLPLVTGAVGALSSMVNTIAGIMELHPAIAIVTGLGVAFGAVALTATVFIGKLTLLRGLFAATGVGLTAMGGGATVAAARITGIVGPATVAAGSMVRLGTSATVAGVATATAGTRILGVLAGILKWAGWVGLAGMMGWAIGTWVKDLQVGGITVGQHTQNIINDMVADFKTGFQQIRVDWNSLLSAIGSEKSKMVADAKAALSEARGNISQIQNTRDQLNIRDDKDAQRSRAASLGAKLRQVQKSGKQGTVTIDNRTYTINPGKATQGLIDGLDKYARSSSKGIMPFTLPNAGENDASKNLKNSLVDSVRGETVAQEAARVNANNQKAQNVGKPPSKAAPKPKDTSNPTPSNQADYSAKNPFAATDATKPKRERGDREWNNPFYASYQDLKNRTLKKVNVSEELGAAPNYEALAKSEFTTKWTKGDFDPDNDPRSRMFTKGSYDKATGWMDNQINWEGQDATGVSVRDWLNQEIQRLKSEDYSKGLRFAAERVGSTRESLIDVFKDYATGTDQDSTAGESLKRQFARQEVRTPIISDNQNYTNYKRDAITNQAVIDYGAYAINAKKINEQMSIDMMESEVDKRKATANLVYNEEVKKLDSIRSLLQDQINEYERLGLQESNSYRAAVEAKMMMEKDFTNRIQLENEKRVRASETATQQMIRQYADLKSNIEGTNKKWTEEGVGALKGLITGKTKFEDLDWRQIGSDMAADYAGNYTEKVFADMYKKGMGGGNLIDMAKSVYNGTEAEGGTIAQMLNKWRGIETTPVAIEAGTDAIGSMMGMTGDASTDPNGVATSGTELSSMFGMLKDKLSPLTEGFGTLWSSVTEASGGLWRFATDALSKAISAIGQWIMSLTASSAADSGSNVIGTLFQAGAAMYGASSGGGGTGAVGSSAGSSYAGIGDSAGTYGMFAKGGMFGTAQAFAKGGAFTNSVVNSPTPFMFANGGSFGNLGVMGEAGPEAVMPLTRDSSGRLGVAVNGGMGGGEGATMNQNNVSISINVASDGTSQSSSNSDDSSGKDWTKMANAVRAIVVEEIVSQNRPGGANYKK